MEEDLKSLFDYLVSNNILSKDEIDIINVCIKEIREASPTDKPILFRKGDRLIDYSQRLSWVIYSVKSYRDKLVKELNKKKDPEYTMLVRQGRPSKDAIEAELRFKFQDLYDEEYELNTFNNFVDYLEHIELSLDRYLKMLKEKNHF